MRVCVGKCTNIKYLRIYAPICGYAHQCESEKSGAWPFLVYTSVEQECKDIHRCTKVYTNAPAKKRIIGFGPKMRKSLAITFKDLFNS